MLDEILGGLQYAGDSLDKLGGRELRGLLGGKPREALSFIPFSDRLGITDPNDIVHGRDLTNKWGLTDPNSNSWGAGAAGMAADALIDPALILGAGMKTGGMLASRWGAKEGGNLARLASTKARQFGGLRMPSKAVPLAGDFFKTASQVEKIANEDTPFRDLIRMADSVGVDVSAYPNNPRQFANGPLNAMAEMAHYDGQTRMIHPNLSKITPAGEDLWSNWDTMNKLVNHEHSQGHFAIPRQQLPAVHEIGHALHHRALGTADPDSLIKSLMGIEGVPQELNTEDLLKAWEGMTHYTAPIASNVSQYGASAPWEFIAEAFGKQAFAGRRKQVLPEALQKLYAQLGGAEVPEELLRYLNPEARGYGMVAPLGVGPRPQPGAMFDPSMSIAALRRGAS